MNVKTTRSTLTVAGALLLSLLYSAPAAAQATRTWISGVGDDANPCSRTAPCKTFPGAISKTAAGGEIDVLDPGGFGAVTITKSITLAAEGSGEGGIVVTAGNGINVNAGPNDIVILRGLQIDGGPPNISVSTNGVKFNTGGTLIIQNCAIRNFNGASPNGYGVSFTPSAASSLFISDTVISSNGNTAAGTGGGVFIQPTVTGSAKATFTRVNVISNVLGIRADGANLGTGLITVAISDSTVAQNTFAGLTAFTPAGGPATRMEVLRTNSVNNGTGLNANGANAVMHVGYSTVTGNNTASNIANGASMTSMGNNLIGENTNPGPVIPIVAPL